MTALALKSTVPHVSAHRSDDALAEELREDIVTHWSRFRSAVQGNQKDYLQNLHRIEKAKTTEINAKHLELTLNKRSIYFRNGLLIDPANIRPKLIPVSSRTVWEDLFKVSRAYWSMPYSKGYGRRLRFVVFDEAHDAVMGIIGLQSPPADLACRDTLLGFGSGRKMEIVNCTLDAYTIGAIPPYTHLLGGKLIASLVASEDIRKAYWRAYANKRTIMEGKLLPQPLLAVTTTSAFGRSSIYNRLRFGSRLLAEPIGWTKGFGTIHLESVYPKIEQWLNLQGLLIPGGFGNGPKVRWQNITNALTHLGLPAKYAEHGLKREVFIFRHVANLEGVCSENELPEPLKCKTDELIEHWLERWALPRAHRDDSWRRCNPVPLIAAGLAELA